MSKNARKSCLPNKQILLIGQHSIQDSLLAGTISQQTGIRCQMSTLDDWMNHVAEQGLLLLVDTSHIQSEQVFTLLQSLYVLEHKVQIALFNVVEGDWGEECIYWPSVNGLFYRNSPRPHFIRGIRRLFDGEFWLSRALTQRYMDATRERPDDTHPRFVTLTAREQQALRLMVTGAKNQDIAEALCLSIHTVKTHIYNLYRKVGARNRVEAVNWGKKNMSALGVDER